MQSVYIPKHRQSSTHRIPQLQTSPKYTSFVIGDIIFADVYFVTLVPVRTKVDLVPLDFEDVVPLLMTAEKHFF